jgi:hypothetical protein
MAVGSSALAHSAGDGLIGILLLLSLSDALSYFLYNRGAWL